MKESEELKDAKDDEDRSDTIDEKEGGNNMRSMLPASLAEVIFLIILSDLQSFFVAYLIAYYAAIHVY